MGIVRLLLALSVMLSHSGPWLGLRLVPSPTAVQVFFIISGFYMAMVLRGKYKGPGALKHFYKNRFLKLFPAYWVVVGFTMLTCAMSGVLWQDWSVLAPWKTSAHAMNPGSGALLVGANVTMLGQDAVLFGGLDPHTGDLYFTRDFWHTPEPQLWRFMVVPQAWSLSLEIMFYMLAPWLVRLSNKAVGAIILVALLFRGYLGEQLGLAGDPWAYRFFPTELALFLAGILAHGVFLERPIEPYLKKVTSVFGVVMIAVTVLYPIVSLGDGSFRWVYFAIAFVGIPAIFEFSKTSRIDRALGDLSFPLYICHFGVFEAIKRVSEHAHAKYLNIDVEYVCAFIGAYLLNRLVIERLEARRHAPSANAKRAEASSRTELATEPLQPGALAGKQVGERAEALAESP